MTLITEKTKKTDKTLMILFQSLMLSKVKFNDFAGIGR